jgi:hypothetical protein
MIRHLVLSTPAWFGVVAVTLTAWQNEAEMKLSTAFCVCSSCMVMQLAQQCVELAFGVSTTHIVLLPLVAALDSLLFRCNMRTTVVPHCIVCSDLLCTSICTHLLQVTCSAELAGGRAWVLHSQVAAVTIVQHAAGASNTGCPAGHADLMQCRQGGDCCFCV